MLKDLKIEEVNNNIGIYTGNFESKTLDEKIYSYRFDVFTENNELFATSGDLIHNCNTNNPDTWELDKTLQEDKEYKINELINQFHLNEILNKKAKTLSGGWQRRLSIAISLINDPKILFLDEPTLGLDVIARKALWAINVLKNTPDDMLNKAKLSITNAFGHLWRYCNDPIVKRIIDNL